ncbi:MAG: glycosyltransferase [Planctomycetes bacterium]|nr:glycosyltransferase [Planctomycetota bacterium]
MRIVINAVSAKMGGAATYLRHLARALKNLPGDDEYILIVPGEARTECAQLVGGRALVLGSCRANRSALHHFVWEQVYLRLLLVIHRVDLLINTSAFGLIWPPCPQTIILRNPIAFSRRYPIHLKRTGDGRRVLDVFLRREMMRISGHCSAKVFVPTDSMGERVLRWLPQLRSKIVTNHYGVEAPPAKKAPPFRVKDFDACVPSDAVVLLYVSHYARHKNFDTLVSAIPLIQHRLNRPVRVVVTARIGEGVRWCGWDTSVTAQKMRVLGVEDAVIQLGTIPHPDLPALYRWCDLFVFPSYLESFGQPLAEAMASGLPVVASDEPVCRELCGDAARYFDTFDPQSLASAVADALGNSALAKSMCRKGMERAAQFSWGRHFQELLREAKAVSGRKVRRPIVVGSGVSVLLITFNEDPNIRKCLESLRWADGVFVVDSFSTDRTVEICREFADANVVVAQHPFEDYASQRNWGLKNLPFDTDWVFALDADEVVPRALADEVVEKVKRDDGRCAGYLGRDRHIFLGRPIRQATRNIVRLFRRGQGRYVRSVNEKLAIEGNLGQLSNRVLHDTRKGLADWVAKNNRYTTMEAAEYLRTKRGGGGRVSVREVLTRADRRRIALKNLFVRMPCRAILKFLYVFLWRRGIFDGVPGLIYSGLTAWVEFQIGIKVFEMELREREIKKVAANR